jgi:hypothetical protein
MFNGISISRRRIRGGGKLSNKSLKIALAPIENKRVRQKDCLSDRMLYYS